MMSELRKVVKTLVWKVQEGAASEHADCNGTFKKLVRNSQCSKSDNFMKLSVLANIPSFS